MPEIHRVRNLADECDRAPSEDGARNRAIRLTGGDQQQGREARREGREAGKRRGGRVCRDADDDREDRRDRRTFERGTRPREAHDAERQHGPGEQFPRTRERQVEREVTIHEREVGRGGERGGPRERDRPAERTLRPARGEEQRHGEHEVELFLHAERPRVQEQLRDRWVEVAGLRPEVEVRIREDGRDQGFAVLHERERRKDERGDGARHGEHAREGRRDPQDPPSKERADRELAGRDATRHVPRDQVPRDHEEDVDADEPALRAGHADVPEHDGEDRDGSKPVDVGPVTKIVPTAISVLQQDSIGRNRSRAE